MVSPSAGSRGSRQQVRWQIWIGAGVPADLLLWSLVPRVSSPAWGPRLLMVLLLCWTQVFALPTVLFGDGRSFGATIAQMLKGTVLAIAAVIVGFMAGAVAACFFGMTILGLTMIHTLSGWADTLCVVIWLYGSIVLGGIAAASVAAIFATNDYRGPAQPKVRYFAASGAIASVALMPTGPLKLEEGGWQSYLVLSLIAIPGLLLTRPKGPAAAPT